jgi:hypothetical protein
VGRCGTAPVIAGVSAHTALVDRGDSIVRPVDEPRLKTLMLRRPVGRGGATSDWIQAAVTRGAGVGDVRMT